MVFRVATKELPPVPIHPQQLGRFVGLDQPNGGFLLSWRHAGRLSDISRLLRSGGNCCTCYRGYCMTNHCLEPRDGKPVLAAMNHSVAVSTDKCKVIYVRFVSFRDSRKGFRVMTFNETVAVITIENCEIETAN